MSYPNAILFDYQGTLIGGSPATGQSFVQPGLFSALSQLKGRTRLAIIVRGLPSEAVRNDLRRLALVDFFDIIASTSTYPRDILAYTLQDLNVPPERALFIGTPEAIAAIEPHRAGVAAILYTGDAPLMERLQSMITTPPSPILSNYTQLPALLSHFKAGGISQTQSLSLGVRLGGLLLGFALGTSAMFYLWQRESRDMDVYGETITNTENL